jgi:lysophospholipase L1-like esterase
MNPLREDPDGPALTRPAPGADGGAVTRRRLGALAATVVIVLIAAVGPVAAVRASVRPAIAGGCPARGAAVRPVVAVVGASFSAGVGAPGRDAAWPADLGRLLHLRVAVRAVPGAGYLNPGAGHRGPFSVLAAGLDLARLRPAAVLIQGGHNDIGRPAAALRHSVRSLITRIHCETPGSRIGVISVFATGADASPAARRTDRIIVAAARGADPRVVIFDPITQDWRFPRAGDQLHPTAAGHRWIAERVAGGLPGLAPAVPWSGIDQVARLRVVDADRLHRAGRHRVEHRLVRLDQGTRRV